MHRIPTQSGKIVCVGTELEVNQTKHGKLRTMGQTGRHIPSESEADRLGVTDHLLVLEEGVGVEVECLAETKI